MRCVGTAWRKGVAVDRGARAPFARLVLRAACCVIGLVLRAEAGQVHRYRVKADSVNLRAAPSLKAEVVSQVDQDAVLIGRSVTNTWLEIVPPPEVEFAVYGDFVDNGTITSARVNVRAGPGINYKVVGRVSKGEKVEVRGRFSDWVKIAPPPDTSLWVALEYVEYIRPPKPPEPAATPKPKPPARVTLPKKPADAASVPAVKPPPPDLDLVPLKGQGHTVSYEGVLRKAGFVIKRPSRYRLVTYERSQIVTVCYVRGNEEQLHDLLGRKLLIRGREYWVQGGRYPVVVPEQIIPR
ncbi:MAG: SH3 domain-containing protein [Kiritimatiellae bacterium]|nr:SH3 domain-containing protein [Kiritimatiellia bacterium]